jgi:hypothetical protein
MLILSPIVKNWTEDVFGHPRLLKGGERLLEVKGSEEVRRVDTILRTEEKSFWGKHTGKVTRGTDLTKYIDKLFENELNTLAHEAIQHYQAYVSFITHLFNC